MVSVPPLFHFLAFLRLRLFEACSKSLQSTHNMLSEFTPQTARILELCYFQKKTYNEAAEELHISASAVKKHIVGALKAFRTRLKEP